jgi:hypothetical protein
MKTQTRFYLPLFIVLLLSLSCSIGLDFQDPTPTPIPQDVVEPQVNPTPADQNEQPQTDPPAATFTPIPTALPLPTTETPRFNTQTVNQSSETPKFTIDFEYPLLENTNAQAAFNAVIQNFRDSNIAAFHQEVNDNEQWRTENVPDFGSDLHVRYITTYQDNALASFRFSLSTYIAGAAHPNTQIHTVTFDLAAGQAAALGQLFNPGSSYLETIANFCMDDLRQQDLLQWEEGAQAVEENYQNWNITPNSLLITFNDYQVAPHAAGIPEVDVPYGILRPVANPDGLLGRFMQ